MTIHELLSELSFYGRPCVKDGSGHEAGYAWAGNKNIKTVNDCTGSSNSFIAGCQVKVAQDQLAAKRAPGIKPSKVRNAKGQFQAKGERAMGAMASQLVKGKPPGKPPGKPAV